MRKIGNYGKEMAVGFIIVTLVFLVYVGMPPAILVMGLITFAAIYMFSRSRGMAMGAAGGKKRSFASRNFSPSTISAGRSSRSGSCRKRWISLSTRTKFRSSAFVRLKVYY